MLVRGGRVNENAALPQSMRKSVPTNENRQVADGPRKPSAALAKPRLALANLTNTPETRISLPVGPVKGQKTRKTTQTARKKDPRTEKLKAQEVPDCFPSRANQGPRPEVPYAHHLWSQQSADEKQWRTTHSTKTILHKQAAFMPDPYLTDDLLIHDPYPMDDLLLSPHDSFLPSTTEEDLQFFLPAPATDL
eukprot:TRINITY_DN15241_c0_g1_i1.p1 TRINITY_DN15241_c0_g1~~TRINITY_DN15241_c0_g1_i1.p1  ORF type:complete len:192 (-),score=24.96 TRINITY_DN15241_c0_g1_i1:78-653(-)